MIFSAFAVCSYAAENEGTTQSPVVDGRVESGEYITERVFDNSDATTGTVPDVTRHPDFAANSVPPEGVSVTEYASEDDEYIYVAFVISQDITTADFYMTGRVYLQTVHSRSHNSLHTGPAQNVHYDKTFAFFKAVSQKNDRFHCVFLLNG